MKHIVIVESPAKAKTINKYLGPDYAIYASYGHVRDLSSKEGSVLPEEEFKMVWDIDEKARSHLRTIEGALTKDTDLILATDPDREGEAIAWHLLEILQQRKGTLMKEKPVQRVTFNAITQQAVKTAIQKPRTLDQNLIEAYLARRALDYLVGFTLSPVLWRKLPGSRSAGRVQSVALRLLCEREDAIEAFVTQEHWDIYGLFHTEKQKKHGQGAFKAYLHALNGEKLDKFSLTSKEQVDSLLDNLGKQQFRVQSLEKTPFTRNPLPPFSTSTLQQDASHKLGFSAQKTMRLAQHLYEGLPVEGENVGLITYMRTDAVQVVPEAVAQAREVIRTDWGANYIPKNSREYKTKAKNAQEAHEAIRPTSLERRPETVAQFVPEEEAKLYALIWRRMIASQMESARFSRTNAFIVSHNDEFLFKATGSVLLFDGFLKLYQDKSSDEQGGEENILSALEQNEPTLLENSDGEQHFTEPPPRFTEAALIKRMEELGIGRPSTYASTLSIIRDRGYALMEKGHFVPTSRGRLVTTFLKDFFAHYVEYDFTADLEEKLDLISSGHAQWKVVLGEFWHDFQKVTEEVAHMATKDVLSVLTKSLAHMIFSEEQGNVCPVCHGALSLKTSRFGAFVGCENYPSCTYKRPFGQDAQSSSEDVILGQDPKTGCDIVKKTGRFGPYIEIAPPQQPTTADEQQASSTKAVTKTNAGAATVDTAVQQDAQDTQVRQLPPAKATKKGKKKESAPPPKRVGIPKAWQGETMTLERALMLLSLPRHVGMTADDSDIKANLGRFGPHIVAGSLYARLPDVASLFSVTEKEALALLDKRKNAPKKRGGPRNVLREVGTHEGEPVYVLKGQYGPYLRHKEVNASLPKEEDVQALSLEESLAILSKKNKKGK